MGYQPPVHDVELDSDDELPEPVPSFQPLVLTRAMQLRDARNNVRWRFRKWPSVLALPFLAPVTVALTVLLLVVFVSMQQSMELTVLWLLGGTADRHFVWEGEWWRLFTPNLLHIDWWHIAIIGFSILVGGFMLEREIGSWRMAVLYVATGGATIAVGLFTEQSLFIGGGGVVAGLLGAMVAMKLGNRFSELARIPWWNYGIDLMLLVVVLVLGWIGLPFVTWGLLAGFSTGLLLGLTYAVQFNEDSGDMWFISVRGIQVGVVLGVLLLCMFATVPWPHVKSEVLALHAASAAREAHLADEHEGVVKYTEAYLSHTVRPHGLLIGRYGWALVRLGRSAEAIAAIERWLEHPGLVEHPIVYLALSAALLDLHRLPEARAAADRMLELSQQEDKIVALWEFVHGDGPETYHAMYEAARAREYERVVSLAEPRERFDFPPQIWSAYAGALYKVGRVDESRQEYERLVQQYPDHPVVSEYLPSLLRLLRQLAELDHKIERYDDATTESERHEIEQAARRIFDSMEESLDGIPPEAND